MPEKMRRRLGTAAACWPRGKSCGADRTADSQLGGASTGRACTRLLLLLLGASSAATPLPDCARARSCKAGRKKAGCQGTRPACLGPGHALQGAGSRHRTGRALPRGCQPRARTWAAAARHILLPPVPSRAAQPASGPGGVQGPVSGGAGPGPAPAGRHDSSTAGGSHANGFKMRQPCRCLRCLPLVLAAGWA